MAMAMERTNHGVGGGAVPSFVNFVKLMLY
jgi:hypothetical protein